MVIFSIQIPDSNQISYGFPMACWVTQAFCSQAKIPVQIRDISVAGRLISLLGDHQKPGVEDPQKSWFHGNPNLKWMMTRATFILGNLLISTIYN